MSQLKGGKRKKFPLDKNSQTKGVGQNFPLKGAGGQNGLNQKTAKPKGARDQNGPLKGAGEQNVPNQPLLSAPLSIIDNEP
jgi:hypothetical protein